MKKLTVPILIGISCSVLLIGCTDHTETGAVSNTAQVPKMTWTSAQPAAPDSLQGKLEADGKSWVKTTGKIKVGDYVQDILDPRLNQPEGRGAIAKVVSVSSGDHNQLVALVQRLWAAAFSKTVSTGVQNPPAALVDFGRGYRTGINISELSRVSIEKRPKTGP